MTYEQTRRLDMPWGHWLRVEARGASIGYVDEDGRSWPSIRDAFWQGRLGMSPHDVHLRDEQLELILAALAAKDRKRRHPVESAIDLYGGSVLLYRTHAYWLQSVGLIDGGLNDSPFDCETNAEGHAVIMMLLATRTPGLNGIPIGREAIRIMGEAPVDPTLSQAEALAAFEAKSAHLTHAFVRGQIGSGPTIALHRRDPAGPMPVVRTIWSETFVDDASRDSFYAWLVARVDRWDVWGRLAMSSGGTALTARFLALLAVDCDRFNLKHPAIALPPPRHGAAS